MAIVGIADCIVCVLLCGSFVEKLVTLKMKEHKDFL